MWLHVVACMYVCLDEDRDEDEDEDEIIDERGDQEWQDEDGVSAMSKKSKGRC